MKVNVLKINDKNLNDHENIYDLDYSELIKDNLLHLAYGYPMIKTKVKEVFQDDFNFLRITTIEGDKYIIAPSKPIDLNKDMKTQQVKEVFERIDIDGNDLSITLQGDGKFLAYIECGDMYVDGYTSKDNESLEDFILRIREPYIEKQKYISK